MLAVVAKMGSYNVVMPMLLFLGLVSSMFMSLNMTLVQTYTSPEMRGRMMSIVMMTFGAMPLSVLPLGALAERIGSANALFASGIMLAVFTHRIRDSLPGVPEDQVGAARDGERAADGPARSVRGSTSSPRTPLRPFNRLSSNYKTPLSVSLPRRGRD